MSEPVGIIFEDTMPDWPLPTDPPNVAADIERQKDLRKLYWLTDISATEIRDAYLPALHPSQVAQEAGPARLNYPCAACGGPMWVTSRSDFKFYCDRITPDFLRCKACVYAQRATPAQVQRDAAWLAEWNARHPPPPPAPDPGLSYAEYLQTEHWRVTRSAALKRAHFSCQVCSSKGELHVHHRTYVRRGHELDSDLIVLCAGCHQIFHDNGKLADGGRAV